MSTQHTPGPWEIVSDHKSPRIESDHGEFVCVASVDAAGFVGLRFPNGGDDGPDARLLTAAPDMYEALKELYAVVKGECPSLLDEDSGGDSRLALEIESALAKAEGKS